MMRGSWVAALILALSSWTTVHAQLLPRPFQLDRVNRELAGQVVDYTNDTGTDHRIWSAALGERREMYVYLPPGYDPSKQYPFSLWLHGFGQDEHSYLTDGVRPIDRAIRDGTLPPAIVAAPDGSLRGINCLLSAGSFWINSPVGGRYEDYLMEDVWNFVTCHYSMRPEPEAHAVVGVSMGGGGAFHTAIKHQDFYKTAVGFMPPLNTSAGKIATAVTWPISTRIVGDGALISVGEEKFSADSTLSSRCARTRWASPSTAARTRTRPP